MRTHRTLLGYVILAAAVGGCATLFQGGGRESPERVAERGLEALERGDYDAGMEDLRWVTTYHSDRGIARYALLALAAAELDPANPNRQMESGSERLSELRALADNPPSTVPVIRSLHRLTLELQEEKERADRAEGAARAASERATVAAREADEAQSGQAALRSRVGTLERELELSRRQLAEARREVARMRQALGG
jgi:hypothetical protein